MATDKQATMLRLRPEVREKIKYLANHERRSINGEIEYCIEYYIQAWEATYGKIQNDEQSMRTN